MHHSYGKKLREALAEKDIIPFIGVYDTFSASVAARHFDGIFVSGFGFAASFYGLPDIGLIAWSDLVSFVGRIRTILPEHHILVDIDDGYADREVACHVVSLLESAGASGVILEDQKRPKRCGHLEGKQLLPLGEFLPKLASVIHTRKEMLVVARTDASSPGEVLERINEFDKAGADWLLPDGMRDPDIVTRIKAQTARPLVFNQIAGGKSPVLSLTELRNLGVSVALYSTPCLFPALDAMEKAVRDLRASDGRLPEGRQRTDLKSCTHLLEDNLARRDGDK
jgi:2-methylisocitrate lyase-like PEP mutase family enzyme